MALRRRVPRLKKGSVGEVDEDASLLCVRYVDGAAGIHGDPRGAAHGGLLKRKQRRAVRLKLVNEAGARVRKEHVAQRIGGKRDRRVKLARAVALHSPGAEEFKRRRRRGLWRGVHAISAGAEEKGGRKRDLRELRSRLFKIFLRHAVGSDRAIARSIHTKFYHAGRLPKFWRFAGVFKQLLSGAGSQTWRFWKGAAIFALTGRAMNRGFRFGGLRFVP